MRVAILAASMMLAAISLPSYSQSQGESSLQESIQGLQKQMSELKSMMEEMRTEMLRSRAEALELRQALEAARGQAGSGQISEPPSQKLEEEQELLSAKVEEQYQTKVESASKYRMRLSGIVLMNMFTNRGAVDNIDFPTIAPRNAPIYSNGSTGGSLRQSQIGFEVFGPQIRGARVSADVQFDFAGGFPNAADGVTFGLPRLRTGVVRAEWPRTMVVAGQDGVFFSPLSPSSIASIAVPAFSYAGNLWTWVPQVRLEHRLDLSTKSNILLQGGLLDPLTGDTPAFQFIRTPQAGEASRRPAYASRVAWSREISGRLLTIGAGGYSSRQHWGLYRNTNAWALTSDWTVPLSSRWEFSGEFYRGRGVGGIGGGIGRTASFSGPVTDPVTRVNLLNSTGGWAQMKFQQTAKLEWNGAVGQDNLFAKDLRPFALVPQPYFDPSIARNRSSLVNFIYRPRSDVLLSIEYRRLKTFVLSGNSEKADHLNVSMGVLF